MMKILHTGELRLPAEGDDSGQNWIESLQWKAFIEIIEFCRTSEVNILLIGGNLFSGNRPSPDMVKEMSNLLNTLGNDQQMKTIMIKGNLDSKFNFKPLFGKHTTFLNFRGPVKEVNVETPSGRVIIDSVLHRKKNCSSSDPRILLYHGSVNEWDEVHPEDPKFSPVSISQLKNDLYNFCALSHYQRNHQGEGEFSHISFCGSPSRIRDDDSEHHGWILWNLMEDSGKFHYQWISNTKEQRIELKILCNIDVLDLEKHIRSKIKENGVKLSPDSPELIYLILEGELLFESFARFQRESVLKYLAKYFKQVKFENRLNLTDSVDIQESEESEEILSPVEEFENQVKILIQKAEKEGKTEYQNFYQDVLQYGKEEFQLLKGREEI